MLYIEIQYILVINCYIFMIIFLKENDREVVSKFLNKQVGGVEVFYPSVTIPSLVEGSEGSKVYLPSSVDDVYMANGILCRSILSVVQELNINN